MELLSTPWDILSSLIIFLVGALIIETTRKKINISRKISFLLYCWHTIFSIVYSYLALTKGADAVYYYETAKLGECPIALGTRAVTAFTCTLTSMNISFLGAFLVFNIFGSLGLITFFASLKSATHSSPRYLKFLVILIVFLPSLSYWTSAIGKDSIAFMSVAFSLWASLNLKNRKLLMLTSILLMFAVRPHVAFIMVLALLIPSLLHSQLRVYLKLLIFLSLIIIISLSLQTILDYVGLSSLNISSVNEFIQQRQGYNLGGGSSIDLKSLSFPMKIFTYLFRPLPFEAHNLLALFASIDNIFLLSVFIITFKSVFNKSLGQSNRMYLWFYSLIVLVVFSLMTANLGIAVRQKWMTLPIFIYLFISMVNKRHQNQSI